MLLLKALKILMVHNTLESRSTRRTLDLERLGIERVEGAGEWQDTELL
jgi:hypothetical protein